MAELFRLARRLRRSLADDWQERERALSMEIARESDPDRRARLKRERDLARQHVDDQRDLADRGR